MKCEMRIYYKDIPSDIYCIIRNVVRFEKYDNEILVTCETGDKHCISMKYTDSIVITYREVKA